MNNNRLYTLEEAKKHAEYEKQLEEIDKHIGRLKSVSGCADLYITNCFFAECKDIVMFQGKYKKMLVESAISILVQKMSDIKSEMDKLGTSGRNP